MVLLLGGTFLTGCAGSLRLTRTPTLAEAPEEERTEWDVVFLSDSSGWGVADRYGAYIEQDLDVRTKVHVSDKGDAVIAGLLRELGYDPVGP
jgi:hypothetical protein